MLCLSQTDAALLTFHVAARDATPAKSNALAETLAPVVDGAIK